MVLPISCFSSRLSKSLFASSGYRSLPGLATATTTSRRGFTPSAMEDAHAREVRDVRTRSPTQFLFPEPSRGHSVRRRNEVGASDAFKPFVGQTLGIKSLFLLIGDD